MVFTNSYSFYLLTNNRVVFSYLVSSFLTAKVWCSLTKSYYWVWRFLGLSTNSYSVFVCLPTNSYLVGSFLGRKSLFGCHPLALNRTLWTLRCLYFLLLYKGRTRLLNSFRDGWCAVLTVSWQAALVKYWSSLFKCCRSGTKAFPLSWLLWKANNSLSTLTVERLYRFFWNNKILSESSAACQFCFCNNSLTKFNCLFMFLIKKCWHVWIYLKYEVEANLSLAQFNLIK